MARNGWHGFTVHYTKNFQSHQLEKYFKRKNLLNMMGSVSKRIEKENFLGKEKKKIIGQLFPK